MSYRPSNAESSTDADEILALLRVGLTDILENLAKCQGTVKYVNLYTGVYNFCTALRSSVTGSGYYTAADTTSSVHGVVYGRRLYTFLNEFIVQFMEQIAERSADYAGDELLAFYNSEWVKFGDSTRCIHHIFDYLNRHWILREQEEGNNVSDVSTLMFHLWRDNFFMQIRNTLLESVFNLMTRVRDGQVVDLGMVKSVADSFVSLGGDEAGSASKKMDVYNNYFLVPFIKATVQYYSAESERLLQDGTIIDYIVRVSERFKEEDERAELYLHESSLSEFKQALTNTLIGNQKESLRAEFKPMLEVHEKDNLRRLYMLLRRLDDKDGLEPLRAVFCEHVKQAGLQAVEQLSLTPEEIANATPNVARLFVSTLLSVHATYTKMLHESFLDDPGFSKALDHACSDFVNFNAICPPSESKASLLLAMYCDVLLKKGSAAARKAGAEGASEDDNLEEQLTQAICIFR
ncbi:ubiquitin ligase (cullin) of SCF, partial [Coemansia aciculifera]